MRLKDRIAIVTGSTSGIGKSIATKFAEEGATVVICGRREELAKSIAADLVRGGHGATAIRLDVTSPESIQSLVDQVVQQFGRIDILVNNSGISPVWKRAEDTSKEVWDQIMQTNLTGTFLCAQTAGRVMIQQKSGKIINVSSVGGEVALPRLVAYCTSKAGIVMLTKVLAVEWAEHGILVNGIGPAFVETDFTAGLRASERIYAELKGKNPLNRFAKAEEIVGTAVFLASDDSNYITGQTIFVDGGWLAT
jgi:2-dehydro-3-deoxy-D-gluconate 5-dehydrogenase